MQELDDITLLREYADRDSEEAFATLVRRHVNKVYSIALRHTRNPHQAEEITQVVFVILARKSCQLSNRVILSGWLCQTARLTALTFIRGEIRRARREQEAHMQNLLNETESDVWSQIAPLLDAAMADLSVADYHAVVLRFFDGKSMKEIGAVLGANEDAAKMRVNRAIEKLRLSFTKHGIVVPSAVLTAAISANSVQAAPVLLAKTATTLALTKGAAASTSTLTLIKGALKFMAWSKAQTAIVVGAAFLLAAGTATIAVKEIASPRSEAWQERFDLSVLDTMPPQVKILPTIPSTLQSGLQVSNVRKGKALGLGQSVYDLLETAYGVRAGQFIFSAPIPNAKYDFIANLPSGSLGALREEIKRKFGLVGRYEQIETNVLVLTVASRNATGLKIHDVGKNSGQQSPGSYSAHNQPIQPLVDYLDNWLRVPVIDETGLPENLDIDFNWESKPSTLDGVRRALREQLGLNLISGQRSVEFIVIEKTKR